LWQAGPADPKALSSKVVSARRRPCTRPRALRSGSTATVSAVTAVSSVASLAASSVASSAGSDVIHPCRRSRCACANMSGGAPSISAAGRAGYRCRDHASRRGRRPRTRQNSGSVLARPARKERTRRELQRR
jgi:hypothetical protein